MIQGLCWKSKPSPAPFVEQQDVEVSLPEVPEEEEITEYRVGPGDVLVINVPGLIDNWGIFLKDPRIIKVSGLAPVARSSSPWPVPLKSQA